MANTDITTLLIDKLKADFPNLVLSGEEAEARVTQAPDAWRPVGSFPLGSPDFLRASQQRLNAGDHVAVVRDPGRSVMVFAHSGSLPPAGAPTPPKKLAAPAASLDKLPPRHRDSAPDAANPFGGLSPKLASVLAQAEDAVQRAEEAARARKGLPSGEHGPAPAETRPEPPARAASNDAPPTPNSRRQLFGFMLLVTLFVYKVVTNEPEKAGKRVVEGMSVPVLADPYKEESLDDLPSGGRPTVVRGGRLDAMGKLNRKQMGRLADAAIPLMRHCYHKALLADPNGPGEGEAVFRVTWVAGGAVEQVETVSAPGDGTIAGCGEQALSQIALPAEVASDPATGVTAIRFKAGP